MAQNIESKEQSILEYLSKSDFLIPIYQRPYTWGENECDELWNDLESFFKENKNNDNAKYFLGSIVLYKDEQGKQNIIDGQQRTTTLSLLICALYDKAFKQKNDKNKQLVSNLASCLWYLDKKSGEVKDYNKFRLESKVISDLDNEIFNSILKRKYTICDEKQIEKTIKNSKSNYEKNYLFFIQQSNNFANNNPALWEDFAAFILDNYYVLPIECKGDDEDDRFDNALRIFNTLNNRGVPLSDADIFKGEIIKNKPKDKINDFIDEWKEIESKIDIQFLFHQYMHTIRARNGDKDSSVIGLRPFFMQKYKELLANPKTMEDIKELSEYWSGSCDDNYTDKALNFYEVLYSFPNDYWKYLDSAIFLYYTDKKNGIDFFKQIDEFLPKIVANLLVVFIDKPTISSIKQIIFNAYVSLYECGKLDFGNKSKQILENEISFKEQFFKAKNLIPSLITLNLMIGYYKDKSFGDTQKWQIEHIHPQTTKWRQSYTGWSNKDEAKPYIESIGNKMWLEQKHNIRASNNYFDNKKEIYAKSTIQEAKELANYPKDDWLKDDIIERGNDIYQRLLKFFKENV